MILRPTGRPLLRRQRHELILLVRVNVVGRLNKHAGEGEAEAAGLLGLLVGRDDAVGLVVVDGQKCFSVIDSSRRASFADGL